MASDVDIVLEVATKGVEEVYKLSNAMQQLNKVVAGVANPMKALDARSRALSAAVGSADSSLKSHAKTVDQLARNNAVLTNELGRVRKEIAGMGTEFKFATGASGAFRKSAIADLKAYEGALKGIRLRALTEDLKGVAQEQKRLGKDAQFVGRSLIIGLTTPIMGFARYGLQALVGIDKEFVRLNKVLENVAPNLDTAAKKMGINLAGATKEQTKQLQSMVNRYNELDRSLTKVSSKFGLAKSLTVGLAGDFAELGIQSEESLAKITELTAATEKLGDMDIGAAKDLVQSLYFQAQRSMQMSGQSRNMTFQEREIAAIGAATAQLNLFNSVENVTALTLRDLGDAFPEVAAAGSSFGLSMTELAGMLAPMKAAGFEVGASANSIKVSLQRLVAPTKQNSDLFKELSNQYDVNFTKIKGTGLDAIQSLIDGFNDLKSSAAGQEGAMEFFAKVFGVRQGPRMEVAIAQMADFDELLKSSTANMDSAEKQLQSFANAAIQSANVSKNANLPMIQSYKDIGIIARIATTQMKEGETRMIDGFGRVTLEQVKAARQVRQAVTDEIVKAQRERGEDIIGQVGTEAGRAMFIELAGAANAAEVAQRELDFALSSLDTQLSILKNNFKSFAADILSNIKPAIEKLTDFSNKLISAWENLDDRTKKLVSTVILGFGGITAAIGPLIFVFGQFRLAMGSVAGVLFKFLPGLKTMSIDAVAGRDAMLRLTKPLTVMGDTVVNTNNKFATFLATLASGEGPVGKLANKIGIMTGALQKQNTASMVLTRSVNAQKIARIELMEVEGTAAIVSSGLAPEIKGFKGLSAAPLSGLGAPGALTGPRPSGLGATASNIVARFGSDKPLRGATGPFGSASSVNNFNKAVKEETFRLLEEAGFTKKNIGDMLRTPTPLTRTIVGPASDQARLNVQSAMGEIAAVAKGTRRFDAGAGLRKRFLDREQASIAAGRTEAEIKKALNAQQVARQEAKGITTQLGGRGTGMLTKERFFKGIKIDDDQFDTIMGGGIKGRLASSKLNLGIFKSKSGDMLEKGAGKFLGGKQTLSAVKGIGTFGKDLFTQPSKALGDFVGLFKNGFSSITGTFSKIGPMFAKIGGYIKNPISLFMKFKSVIIGLGPAIMTAVSSFGAITGIGLIIGAIVAVVIVLVKNWDAFVAAIQPGIDALKDTFDILKEAVMGLVQPFIDFFSSIGGEGEGTNAIVATIATAFNILADVVKVLAIALKFVFVEIFGRIIKVALSSLLAMLKGIGNFIMGLWGVIKGIFTFNWSSIVDGFKKIAKGIAQTAIGMAGPFADFFVFVLKGVKMIFDQLAKLPGWLGGGAFKKASQGIGAAITFVEDTRNLKKGKGKGGKDTPEVDTDPMQEQIANASGDGLKEGADEGAKELAKRAKQALRDLKREVQEEIASRIKDAMNDVVENIKTSLKNQKEASLAIYDAQIKKIEDVGKAEEKLTKDQEYQNKLREAEDQRALNRLNNRRSYAMAIYAGNIDEARAIADAGAQQEREDTKKIGEINEDRIKQVAEDNRKAMIDSIKDAKEASSKYFDNMIESFTNAAKKITEFPPTTAEEFNTMLNQLIEGGNGFIGARAIANSMGTTFSESFSGALSQLGVNATGPLTSSLGAIAKTLADNNPFGPTGIWNTTIDASIDALTRKYTGLTNTLTTIINTKSTAFQNLLDIYKKYQTLVNPSDSTGGTGGGGGGNTNGGYGKGFNNDGVKVGNKVAIAAANADLGKIKAYSDKYLEEKYGKTAEGKKIIAAIKGSVGAIASSSVLLGGHDEGMKDFMPVVLASKYRDQIRTNSELVYAYIVNHRAQFLKGSGAQGRTDESGRSGFFKGGMLPYGKGGATQGPVQQGIPALLHGGEYVVRNSAVKRYGWGMMDQINRGTYKPKPFANGGMVQDPVRGNVNPKDRAYKEWLWQQSHGGFSEAYMNAIGTAETGDAWKSIGPKWRNRVKTSDGWMGGGLAIEDRAWTEYGGKQFAETAGLASALQQMVIKNRMAVFGYIRKIAASKAFPAGTTSYNPPLGTGGHSFVRSSSLDGKTRIPRPEDFNPNIPLLEQMGTSPKNYGSDNNAFINKKARDSYVSYFTGKSKNLNKITMPFSDKSIWVSGKGVGAKTVSNIKGFNDFNSNFAGFFNGGLVKGYENGGMPLPVPTPQNPGVGSPPPPYKTWAEYFANNGSTDPSVPSISIPYSKTADKYFDKYWKKGYINNDGIFSSPYGKDIEKMFTTIPFPGVRWAPQDVLGGKPNYYGISTFSGTEAVGKGGTYVGKDWNVWNAKAERERLQGKGILSPFKSLGFNALSLLTDTKFSLRRTVKGENIDKAMAMLSDVKNMKKEDYLKLASLLGEDAMNLIPFFKAAPVGTIGYQLAQSAEKAGIKNITIKMAETQISQTPYVKKAIANAKAALDTELLHNPNAWYHGNKGPIPVWESLEENLRRERVMQLVDSGMLQPWDLSPAEQELYKQGSEIARRTQSQSMLIGPGMYSSHAGLGSHMYTPGGGRLSINRQSGFYPDPKNQFDLSQAFPFRSVNSSEQFLRTMPGPSGSVYNKNTSVLWNSMKGKIKAQTSILRGALDVKTPLSWLYDEFNSVKPSLFKDPSRYAKEKIRKLTGKPSVIDWESFTESGYPHAPLEVSDEFSRSKGQYLDSRLRQLSDVKTTMDNFLKKNPNATILDFLQSRRSKEVTDWYTLGGTKKMPVVSTIDDGLESYGYGAFLDLLNVPLKFSGKEALQTVKLTHLAPNNNPMRASIFDLLTPKAKSKFEYSGFDNFSHIQRQYFPTDDAYKQALKLYENAHTVRFGGGRDAYIFDPSKPYRLQNSFLTRSRTMNNPASRFMEVARLNGPIDAFKDLFGQLRPNRRVVKDLQSGTTERLFENPASRIPEANQFIHKYDITEMLKDMKIIKPHDLSKGDIVNLNTFIDSYIQKMQTELSNLEGFKFVKLDNTSRSIYDTGVYTAKTRIKKLEEAKKSVSQVIKMSRSPRAQTAKDLISVFDNIFTVIGKNGYNSRVMQPGHQPFEEALKHFKIPGSNVNPFLTKSEAYLDFSKRFGYDAIAHRGGVFTSSKFKHLANSIFIPEKLGAPTQISAGLEIINAKTGIDNAANIIHDRVMNIINSKQRSAIKEKALASLRQSAIKSGVNRELLNILIPNSVASESILSRANGGIVPGFGSQGIPAMLHGGEYVINSSAVKNIGIAALQAMNNMRFNTPKAPSYSGPVNGQASSTSTTHIYVENFIGEKQWFESMMKDYNVNVAPQNQRAAGLNNTTISTYSGINRGL